MKTLAVLVLFSLISYMNAQAQTPKIESLRAEIETLNRQLEDLKAQKASYQEIRKAELTLEGKKEELDYLVELEKQQNQVMELEDFREKVKSIPEAMTQTQKIASLDKMAKNQIIEGWVEPFYNNVSSIYFSYKPPRYIPAIGFAEGVIALGMALGGVEGDVPEATDATGDKAILLNFHVPKEAFLKPLDYNKSLSELKNGSVLIEAVVAKVISYKRYDDKSSDYRHRRPLWSADPMETDDYHHFDGYKYVDVWTIELKDFIIKW